MPLAALTLPAYIYLPSFYAGELGLGLAIVGAVLFGARLWDVATDPLIGWLSDRTKGRFGRRRPWIVAGTPLAALAIWMLFAPPQGVGPFYLLGWSLALYLAWTMIIVPLSALGAELSPLYHQRSRIAAWREMSALVGTVLALAGLAWLDGARAEGLAAMGVALALALPLAVGAMVRWAPEPTALAASRRPAKGLAFAVLAGNRPFRLLLLAYLVNGCANGLPATLFLLYVGHVLAMPWQAGLCLLVYFVAGIAAMPAWLRLSYRYGKHRVWCGAMLACCAAFAWTPLLGAGDLAAFIAICVVSGACLGADLVLPPAMQADVIDVDEAAGGQGRAGLFFALWGMATKLALALAVGVAFPLLDLAGFRDGAGDNEPAALLSLALLYGALPVALKLVAIALMWRYPLGPDAVAALRSQIDASSDQRRVDGPDPSPARA
jgi:GPH family glycoside/pentoside/hexuronide:cation symporter